jgi:hypothetical protein
MLALGAVALTFVGWRIVDRGREMSAAANSTEERLGEVTRVLQQAAANAAGQGAAGGKTWANRVNAVCARQSNAVGRLGTPVTVDEIAAYLRKALPIVRRHHKRLAALPPPPELAQQASRAGQALLKQEALLADVRAAAQRGDATATLAAIDKLRALARKSNPNLVRLSLTECALPSPGLPLR